MVEKSLDRKLRRLHADPHGCKDFILADAKDADMALAIGAPGRSPEAHGGELRFRSLAEYRALIEQVVEQGLVDIMLMSASTSEVLTIHQQLFDHSTVTPAARANKAARLQLDAGIRARSAVLASRTCRRSVRVECDRAAVEHEPDPHGQKELGDTYTNHVRHRVDLE